MVPWRVAIASGEHGPPVRTPPKRRRRRLGRRGWYDGDEPWRKTQRSGICQLLKWFGPATATLGAVATVSADSPPSPPPVFHHTTLKTGSVTDHGFSENPEELARDSPTQPTDV